MSGCVAFTGFTNETVDILLELLVKLCPECKPVRVSKGQHEKEESHKGHRTQDSEDANIEQQAVEIAVFLAMRKQNGLKDIRHSQYSLARTTMNRAIANEDEPLIVKYKPKPSTDAQVSTSKEVTAPKDTNPSSGKATAPTGTNPSAKEPTTPTDTPQLTSKQLKNKGKAENRRKTKVAAKAKANAANTETHTSNVTNKPSAKENVLNSWLP